MTPPAPPAGTRVRLLDATLSEAVRGPGRVMDRTDMEALCRTLPLPGLPGAAPVYPEGAYGWDLLLQAARRAVVLEPVTPEAHRHVHRHLDRLESDGPPARREPLPLPERSGTPERVLVDPQGVPLEEADAEVDDASGALPSGWVRERVVVLSGPREEGSPGPLPRRTGDPNVLPRIALLVARMPRDERLRVRDPHGAITPELAARLAGLVDAPRLTLHLENPDGLAAATARAALTPARGPLVRTTILGIGPRTGLPPTELFQPPTQPHVPADAIERAVQCMGRHAGIPTPRNHPFWGSARRHTWEPEHVDDPYADVQANPATIRALLERHEREWGLTLEPEQKDRVLGRLLATLRPGEQVTGPVLWAVVAQETELTRHAARKPPS